MRKGVSKVVDDVGTVPFTNDLVEILVQSQVEGTKSSGCFHRLAVQSVAEGYHTDVVLGQVVSECIVHKWMSLSKGLYQGCMRLMHGMKEKGSKCEYSNIKCVRDSNAYSSSLKQAGGLSGALDSDAYKAAVNDKVKQAEDSLRIVMYLSCWGPN
ncbi:hypothetical protein RJ639_009833 [Escallonia herrerae]|uniref:Uncharacterized protein n=1 Tax=Escallonia herrerae TaxID=1293975 RepID=A0AA88VZQ4_9ASTE|nr:hypothetical protein RJ639_009833 [Escallonia herrerae]